MSGGELRFVLVVVVIVLLATTLPYGYAYWSSPPDKQFMGIILNVPDTAQYLSWLREFGQAFLVQNKLTPESNEPVFFNILWLVLGRLAVSFELDIHAIFQAFRLFAAVAFLLVAYCFCALFLAAPLERKVAFLLATFGAGFGWLLVAYKQFSGILPFPLDVYISETNTLLSILAFPHSIAALTLMLLILALVIKAHERQRTGYALVAAVVALLLGLQHAYDLIVVWAVLGLFAALVTLRSGVSRHLLVTVALVFLFSLPAALYSLYITRHLPVWREVLKQYANAGVYTPDPFHLLVLVGPTLPLALLTFDGILPLKRLSEREILIKAWFIVVPFLAYIPADYQIKMLLGWQIPIAILATRGLFRHIVPALGEVLHHLLRIASSHSRVLSQGHHIRLIAAGILLMAVLPTNLYLLAWRFVDLGRHDYPYYLYRDDVQAMAWLESNSDQTDVVISSLTIGQYIPSQSGNKAFLAHWAQTLDFYGKERAAAEFYSQEFSDNERRRIVNRFGVDYVFYSAAERKLGTWIPDGAAFLDPVYTSTRTRVYRVAPEVAK